MDDKPHKSKSTDMRRTQAGRREVELDFHDVMTRLLLVKFAIRELQVSTWEKLIKWHIHEVSALTRSTDPRQGKSRFSQKEIQQLQEHHYWERVLADETDFMKEKLDNMPVTLEQFRRLQKRLEEIAARRPLTQLFLDDLADSRLRLKKLWDEQQDRHRVDARWREADREARLKELENELSDLEVLFHLHEFETQLRQGRMQLTGDCKAVKELHDSCSRVLEDCQKRLRLLTWSLEPLQAYLFNSWRKKERTESLEFVQTSLEESWRQMERTESPTPTAARYPPQQLDSRAPEETTPRKDQVRQRRKSFP